MMSRLTFAGAAGTVTGSRFLLEHEGVRVLIDCGLFQGLKNLRNRNWEPFFVDPASIDAVVLTHAHIDHSGYLPRLCELGFGGPIYCTPGTLDLLQILLTDAGHLQEEEARHANKYRYSKHEPAVPLYTRAQAERSLAQLTSVPYQQSIDIADGVSASFTRAGHILGSACVRVQTRTESIVFTGDVGRPSDPIMRAPEPLPAADFLVTESTYGDRRHPEETVSDELEKLVVDTVKRGGTLVIPAFAVGRSQHMLHLLAELKVAGRIPALPAFLDSPMAITATEIFCNHPEEHRLSAQQCRSFGDWIEYARTTDDSKAIDRRMDSMIVISASGMATGGRVLHHLKRFLPDPANSVLLVGYQAAGTRGRSLVDGADELKIHGAYVRVRARVVQVQGLSAHADYAELLDWFGASAIAPRRAFVVHGEPSAADALRRRLSERFGWAVEVPNDRSVWDLTALREVT